MEMLKLYENLLCLLSFYSITNANINTIIKTDMPIKTVASEKVL